MPYDLDKLKRPDPKSTCLFQSEWVMRLAILKDPSLVREDGMIYIYGYPVYWISPLPDEPSRTTTMKSVLEGWA